MSSKGQVIQVLVKSPFSYQFRQKPRKYLVTNDYLTLHTVRDAEELAYITSESFPYKNYVHIEGRRAISDSQALAELEDLEMLSVPSIASYDPYQDLRTRWVDPTTPTQDAVENPHAIETLIEAGVSVGDLRGNSLVSSIPSQGEVNTVLTFKPNTDLPPGTAEPLDVSSEAPSSPSKPPVVTSTVVATLDDSASRTARSKDLSKMTSEQVKALAESYGVDYTNKLRAIDSILNIEFPA